MRITDLPVKPTALATVAEDLSHLMQSGEIALQNGQLQEAFTLFYKAKAYRLPTAGLDFLRARCFLKLGKFGDARESLYEELRLTPGHVLAQEMLETLRRDKPDLFTLQIPDNEFQEIQSRIRPFTMIPEGRLYNLFRLAKIICAKAIPGQFVECGVAAGGSSAMLARVILDKSSITRKLYSFDSFEGMPTPTPEDKHQGMDAESTGWGSGTCAAPEASLLKAAGILGVTHLITPVKGLFKDTLPIYAKQIGPIAFLHLDGDWYESTRDILNHLYDQVVPGALMQVDDYGHWDGCKKAMHEFERQRGLRFDYQPIDGSGVFFSKPT
jgi:hypothetical protein